jgi:hypothetical protein
MMPAMHASMILLSLLAVAPLTQPPRSTPDVPLLSDLDLPLERLAAWGRREFTYELRQGAEVRALGTVALTTAVADGQVTLTDRLDIEWDGKPHWLEVSASGPLRRGLRPDFLNVKGTPAGADRAPFEFLAEVDATTLRVTLDGSTRSEPLEAGAVTDSALLRLLTLLPRRPGFAARIEHVLAADRLEQLPGATLFCTGVESVALAGGTVEAHRFDATREGDVFLSAWVDGEGRLVQACFDQRKYWVAKG